MRANRYNKMGTLMVWGGFFVLGFFVSWIIALCVLVMIAGNVIDLKAAKLERARKLRQRRVPR